MAAHAQRRSRTGSRRSGRCGLAISDCSGRRRGHGKQHELRVGRLVEPEVALGDGHQHLPAAKATRIRRSRSARRASRLPCAPPADRGAGERSGTPAVWRDRDRRAPPRKTSSQSTTQCRPLRRMRDRKIRSLALRARGLACALRSLGQRSACAARPGPAAGPGRCRPAGRGGQTQPAPTRGKLCFTSRSSPE